MPDFRRGASAIAQAATDAKNKQKGNFAAFAPSIFLKDDGDEKFLLFLNPLDEIPQVDLIDFIPVSRKKADGTKYTAFESVIARTDSALGESEDPMTDQWDASPKERNIAVAIELEPTFAEVKGRKKAIGFEIATRAFQRRVRDEDGELTDDYEEVVAPQIGFFPGSPHTLYASLSAHDKDLPLEAYPVKVRKIGSGTTQSFQVVGFEDVVVDLDALIDGFDGITYLSEEERDSLEQFIPLEDALDEDYEEEIRILAYQIGKKMLDKRLHELADLDRYNSLLNGITASLDKFGNKKGSPKKEKVPTARATRPSARKTRPKVALEETEAEAAETTAEEVPTVEEVKAPKPRATRKSKPKVEEAPEEPAEAPVAKAPKAPKRASDDRLAALRAKVGAR